MHAVLPVADVAGPINAEPGLPVNARLGCIEPPEPPSRHGRVLTIRRGIGPVDSGGFANQAMVVSHLRRGRLTKATEAAAGILAGNGPSEDEWVAVTALAIAAWQHGQISEAISLLRAAVARVGCVSQSSAAIQPHLLLATVLIVLGDFPSATAVLKGSHRPRDESHGLWSARADGVTARLHLAAGRLSEASTAAAAGLQVAESLGEPALKAQFHWVRAVVALFRDDVAAATDQVRRYQSASADGDDCMDSSTYDMTAASLADAQEGPASAYEVVRPLFGDPLSLRRLFVLSVTAPAFLVRVALAAGDKARATSAVNAAELLARDNAGFHVFAAASLQALGLLQNDPRLLQQAASLHQHPWAKASALEDLGSALGNVDVPGARTALEKAASKYESMAADHDVSRVAGRIHRLKVPRKEARRERPVEGWESLTQAERRVAELVAEGMTNQEVAIRLFVSRHTVDFHLRSIYRKLNVHSRVRVARLFDGVKL